jgi:cysteine synthase A
MNVTPRAASPGRSAPIPPARDGSSVLERIGGTPMIRVGDVFAKLECANPTGSVKDRSALHTVRMAARSGVLRPGATIVESTSGNTGISLAMVARELGYRLLVFMPEHMSPERRRMMERLGAEVRLTPRAAGVAGAVQARDAYRGRPGYWVTDQFSNPENVASHRKTTGPEILHQLACQHCRKVDFFVAGVGTGATLMGVGQVLRAAMPRVRIVAVEPAEANALCGGPPGEHGIMGIGAGFVPDLIDRRWIDDVMTVSTAEALATTRELRTELGYCLGISSGANMHIARRLARDGARVLTIWPDSADRYASVGLEPVAQGGSRCALQPYCVARAHALLHGTTPAPPAAGEP